MKRARILTALMGMAAIPLIIAACGGSVATASPDLSPTSTPTATPTTAAEPTDSNQLPSQETPIPANSGPSGPTNTRDGSGVGAPRPPGRSLPHRGAPWSPLSNTTPPSRSGISVTGRGEVTAVPDLAILNAGVEARAATVERARVQAAEAMDRIAQVLAARGISSGDVQTRFFNISPEYVWNDTKRQQELVGYRVSNQARVRIRDMGSVGPVIDEVAGAGGDLVRIQGIRFTVEDTGELESQAREKAIENLLAKAQQFAELTGVRLGKPVFLSESGGFAPRPQSFDARNFIEMAPAAAGAPTPISGGELTVTIMVQGTFSIIE